MGYEKRYIGYFTKKQAIFILISELGIKDKYAQRIIDRKMLYLDDEIITDKTTLITGNVYLIEYVPVDIGVYPIGEYKDLIFYDKPSSLLTHPKGRKIKISLLDSMRLISRDVNPVHRLDKETSGLLIASKNKESERYMKMLFESREITKNYIAYVEGDMRSQIIDIPLKRRDDNLVHNIMIEDKNGKSSQTEVIRINYNKKRDITLVKLIPYTGRTHQLRVHCYLVNHKIIGDMTYGVNDELARRFLDKEIEQEEILSVSRGNRLMLHASFISFEYEKERIEIDNTHSLNSIYNRDKITII